jgi:uncharacterized UPF0160 family protein
MKKDIKKLVTHNGSFHADDLFACAVLSMVLQKSGIKFEIIRTRDTNVVKNGDYVFDVGGIYDPKLNRFDHHQKNGAGYRSHNNIPYASFGLVWKHFGMDLCDNNKDVWSIIDSKIVAPIDAIDNGFDIAKPKYGNIMPYGAEQVSLIFSPTWEEDESRVDDIFRDEVTRMVRILRREIQVAKSDILGKHYIRKAYQNATNKEIIELSNTFPRYLYQDTLSSFKEPIYVIYESRHSKIWKIEAIQKSPTTLESRRPFPENWRGFLNGDPQLVEITGVSDILFCHRNGFLLTVKSKEGALKLAEIALNS